MPTSLRERLFRRLRLGEVPGHEKAASVPASPDDVKSVYRLLLGREPEDDMVIAKHMDGKPSMADLIIRISSSVEAKNKLADTTISEINAQRMQDTIEVNAEPNDMTLLLEHITRVWSRYGEAEAYYSVLTDPIYLAEKITADSINNFYASGDVDFHSFEACFHRNGLNLNSSSSILELGCGVGRIGAAFAERFSSYVGVDISAAHLSIAEQRFSSLGLADAKLLHLNKFLTEYTTYDLFYSILVLQHNPPPIISYLLDMALERLLPNGFAYFQVPSFVFGYTFSVQKYLNGDGKKDMMEVHAFPEREMFTLFRKHDIEIIEVIPDQHIGSLGFSTTFFVHKRSV